MAKEISKFTEERPDGPSSYAAYLSNFSELTAQFGASYSRQLGEDNPDEVEQLNIFTGVLNDATRSVEKEMMAIYAELDNDSRSLLNRHLDNSGIIRMQRSAIGILASNKKKSKLELIIEIIKKVGLQLLELLQSIFNFPDWLNKLIKIIIGLLNIIDNVLHLILELLGINGKFLKEAERNLLTTFPMWHSLGTVLTTKPA
ncbi:MAG: hypothetical protein ABMA02_03695 [Saprospiraceae bacterium]